MMNEKQTEESESNCPANYLFTRRSGADQGCCPAWAQEHQWFRYECRDDKVHARGTYSGATREAATFKWRA